MIRKRPLPRLSGLTRPSLHYGAQHQSKPKLGLVLAGVVFAGLGLYLLHASKADVASDDQTIELSLAPAEVTVAQGDYINIAVNVDSTAETYDKVQAAVDYPKDALQLVGVHDVCPQDSYGPDSSHDETAGSVSISCTAPQALSGKRTVANLTFRALHDSNQAPLTIADNSIIHRHADGAKVRGRRHGASVALSSHAKLADKTPRTIARRASRPACNDPAPGHVRCLVRHVVDDSGHDLSSPLAQASGYGPKEFHMAYQLPCTPGGPVAVICAAPSSYSSQPLIAIVEAGDYKTGPAGLESDLQTFNQQFGLPACTRANGCLTVVNQTGGTSLPPDAGWSDEYSLDVEAIHAVCQTCRMTVIEADKDFMDKLDAATDYATTLNPVAISNSWSGGGDPGTESKYDHTGVAIVNADGDSGFDSHPSNEPADYPTVIVSSGTTLKVNGDGTWAGETLWNGSGAGCSPISAAPAWQKALPNWQAAGCGSQRAYGDLSADADPNTGLATYGLGTWVQSGGTSLSAPLVASMFALAGGLASGTTGASQLYAGYTSKTAAWHDITSGSDCTAQAQNHCTAGPGYDVPTGLGSPNGLGALLPAGSPTPSPSPTPTPTPTPNPGPSGKVGDFDSDGKVTLHDLSLFLGKWHSAGPSVYDLDGSGSVDLHDLSLFLSNYGK